MEYEYRRYSNPHPFVFPPYYPNDRNAPLSMTHHTRPNINPRACPISGPAGGPTGGLRSRSGATREDEVQDSGPNSRRRIAVACARCRKRKIRCSGDPGDGTGCTSCKHAGVDMSGCQFHRVGSTDINQIMNPPVQSFGMGSGLHLSNHHSGIPLYGASGSIYRTPSTTHYPPQLDTKSTVYPQTWTIPSSEETSPVDSYGLDQPTQYMSNSNVYGHYRYPRALHGGTSSYLDQDASTSYASSLSGIPYMHTSNLRPATTTEALSPLNMTSIQSALPISLSQRPQRHLEASLPLRQLPRPQPSPAQSARNTVDLLQDQRLRYAPVISGTSMNFNGSFAKPTGLSWNTDASGSEIQSTPSSESSSAELVRQTSASGPLPSDGAMGYIPITTSGGEENPPTGTLPQINFSTSTLLDSMTAPATTAAYSNFRDYALPTSSSPDAFSILAHQPSQTNSYSFSVNAKRNSFGGSPNEAALVSGQRYTPLDAEAHPATGLGTRQLPIHRASLSNLNRSF